MKQNKLTITITIPTHEANDHLVETLKSIYRQTDYKSVKEILVLVDGKKLSPKIARQIKNSKLRVIEYKVRQGQSTRINDSFRHSHSDLTILTNDDVIWRKDALRSTIKTYARTRADLICSRISTMREKTLFGQIQETGQKIVDQIKTDWKHGDNYLSANGRFLAISKNLKKTVTLPKTLWNNDAYLYFWAKTNNFVIAINNTITCEHRLPSNYQEYLNQSRKFKNSFAENQKYFKSDLTKFYKIPFQIKLLHFSISLIREPFLTILHTFLSSSVNFAPKKGSIISTLGYWQTDYSTKQLKKNN